MERNIRVTGKGTLSVKPNRIRILIARNELKEMYEGAVRASAEKKALLTNVFAELGFPNDNALLGQALGKLAACPDEPNFSIEYTISDPEAIKNELLAKAKMHSPAAGVTLGVSQKGSFK